MQKHGELWLGHPGDSLCEHKVYWQHASDNKGWWFQHGDDTESIFWLPTEEWQSHEPLEDVPQWKHQVKAWVRYLHEA